MTIEKKRAGRPSKEKKKCHCVMVRFTDEEYADFLAMHAKSGVKERAIFLKAHFFGREFFVRTFDDNTLSYYQELKNIKAEINKIGVNYNQFITTLKKHFTEHRAAITAESSAKLLSQVLIQNDKALQITLQLVRRWLPK